jgi:transcriptional regulator with XRE-family HTH domain
MADSLKKLRAEVRRSQADFTRAQAQRDKASETRRETFERAQGAGMSLREIAKESGLHFSRVAEILRGK